MKLMHIQGDGPNGDNLDWFAVAADRAQAVDLWLKNEIVADAGCKAKDVTQILIILDDVTGTRFDGPARIIDYSELREA